MANELVFSDEPNENPKPIEQPAGRGGRRPGTKNTLSKDSRIRLNELGFDPIAKQIEMFEEIERQVYEMLSNEKGYSQIAYAQLMNTKQKIANDLMRYGYARTPETNEIKTINTAPVKIVLTKDNYVPGPLSDENLSDIPKDLLGEDNGEQS